MDVDNLIILFIILSFIARAVGDVLKGGKKGPDQKPQPRQRLPQQAPRQQLPQSRAESSQRPPRQQPQRMGQRTSPAAERGQRTSSAEERAAELIPAELWEILTGQQRPAPSSRPQPVPDEADDDEELVADEESLIVPETTREDRDVDELLRSRREAADLRARGPEPYRPLVVSLETPPLPTAARHAAFHQKHAAQDPARVIRRGPAPGIARLAGSQPGALRRAIILQEVLGKPKGLE